MFDPRIHCPVRRMDCRVKSHVKRARNVKRGYRPQVRCAALPPDHLLARCRLPPRHKSGACCSASPQHDSRIVGARELLFPSTLPGSFDECGSCPFFALAASQELAQKYPLTTLWPYRLPAESVRLSGKGRSLVAPGSVEPRDHALVIKMNNRGPAIGAGSRNLMGGG